VAVPTGWLVAHEPGTAEHQSRHDGDRGDRRAEPVAPLVSVG
jgi:hypothetical protein